jgi:hypothetical protein
MATAALVDKTSIDLGRRVIAALSRQGIGVAVGLWAFASQSEEWQLTIATPLVDELGPLAAYGKVQKALQKAGIEDEFPLRRIFLRSPKDRVLQSLQKESRALEREDYRLVNASIEGSFIEDAYLYRGFIDIVESENIPGRRVPSTYFVTYAPYSGPGDTTVRVNGLDNLRELLLSKLHINPNVTESTLRELSAKRAASIPNVQLRARDLKHLRPA